MLETLIFLALTITASQSLNLAAGDSTLLLSLGVTLTPYQDPTSNLYPNDFYLQTLTTSTNIYTLNSNSVVQVYNKSDPRQVQQIFTNYSKISAPWYNIFDLTSCEEEGVLFLSSYISPSIRHLAFSIASTGIFSFLNITGGQFSSSNATKVFYAKNEVYMYFSKTDQNDFMFIVDVVHNWTRTFSLSCSTPIQKINIVCQYLVLLILAVLVITQLILKLRKKRMRVNRVNRTMKKWWFNYQNYIYPFLLLIDNPWYFFGIIGAGDLLAVYNSVFTYRNRALSFLKSMYPLIFHCCYMVFMTSDQNEVLVISSIICLAVFLVGSVHLMLEGCFDTIKIIITLIKKKLTQNMISPSIQTGRQKEQKQKKKIKKVTTFSPQNKERTIHYYVTFKIKNQERGSTQTRDPKAGISKDEPKLVRSNDKQKSVRSKNKQNSARSKNKQKSVRSKDKSIRIKKARDTDVTLLNNNTIIIRTIRTARGPRDNK